MLWKPDSRAVLVQTTDRPQTRLDLWRVDRDGGKTTLVLTDTDEAWVNQKEVQVLDGGRDLLVSSERDGHTHLYRYDADGRLLNSVTRGPWSVRGPSGFYGAPLDSAWVDPKSELGLLHRPAEAGGRAAALPRPRRRHGHAAHHPRGRHAHDHDEPRPALLPRRVLEPRHAAVADAARRRRGAPGRARGAARRTSSRPFDFEKPEIFTRAGGDGFALPARILKPRGFDPAKKYPAIVYIYGGPGAPTVNDAWDYSFAGNALFDQVLAARGYVVFSVDPRSATGQSKTLENAILRKMQTDDVLDDIVAGVRWLKAQPFVDPGRVGVWGWSGGGTDTLLVMTRSEEFKAGIAVAPVTDWHFYDTKFAETYMKTPGGKPRGLRALRAQSCARRTCTGGSCSCSGPETTTSIPRTPGASSTSSSPPTSRST